jgi:hypothetical protein
VAFDPPKREGRRDVRLTEVRGTSCSGYRAMKDRSRSLLGLSTVVLPEQHSGRPPLEWVTNDLLSRLPFETYRSRYRAAGADSLPPKGRLDGCLLQSSPKGPI